MIETTSKTIDGHEYMCTSFAARKGFALQARLTRFVSPMIAGLKLDMAGGEGNASLLDAAFSFDGAAVVKTLLEHIDDNVALKLVLDLLETTYRDNQQLTPAHFDSVYAGNYGELMKAVAFAIEANGFFGLGREGGGLTGLLGRVKFPAPSTNASAPNGPSGE